jgi:hypothetical protein
MKSMQVFTENIIKQSQLSFVTLSIEIWNKTNQRTKKKEIMNNIHIYI